MSKISTLSSKLLTALSAVLTISVFMTLSMSFTPVDDEDLSAANDSISASSGRRRSHWTTSGDCSTTYHNKNDYGKTIGQSLGNGYTTVTENTKNATATNSTATAAGSQSYVLWNTGMGENANQDYEGEKKEGELTVAHTNSVTFLATPSDPEEYRFAGWYDDAAGTAFLSNDNPYTTEHVIPGASYGNTESNAYQSASSPHTKTIYAKFEAIPSTSVTFLAASTPAKDKGSYTVVGKGINQTITTSNQTVGVKSITLTATPSEATEFLNWYKLGAGDEKIVLSTENPFTTSFTETSTVGVEWRELKNNLNITFKAVEKDANGNRKGSYTVDGTTVSATDYVHFTGSTYKYRPTLVATPATGYGFKGWYVKEAGAKKYLSTEATWNATITDEVTIYADFVYVDYPAESLALFKVGSTSYTDLNAANTAAKSASKKVIVCTRDGYLLPGNYTISSGVSLLIPYSSAETVQTEPAVIDKPSPAPLPNAYRTLTMLDGADITCEGTICVGGQIISHQGGNATAYPAGDLGVINMANGGHIELKSGATLYAWGFIKGQDKDQGNNTTEVGTITANSGSTVWEDIPFGDFRGGSQLAAGNDCADTYRWFPFQSYTIQNIEVPLTIKYGASEKVFAVLYIPTMDLGTQKTKPTLIANSDALFLLKDSKSGVRKWYDPTTDLVCYELSGTAQLDQLKVSVNVGFTVTVESSDFDLPICGNMHIILTNCNMTLSKPMTMHAGSVIEIKPDATVTIASNLHVFDLDQFDMFANSKYYLPFNNLTSHKYRGTGTTKEYIDDAKLIVDGTLKVTGGIYTTANGANIMGNGGGKVIFSSALPTQKNIWFLKGGSNGTKDGGTHYHYDGILGKGAADIYLTPYAVNAANLCNEDGTYTKSSKNTFYNVHGRWFIEGKQNEQANHTHDFTYMASGNSGDNVNTPAVYSHDRTGLEPRMKWFNVSADGCTDWWVDGSSRLYNWTKFSDWHQFIPTEVTDMYGCSDGSLYNKISCNEWEELGGTDENCLYTIGGVKKALVGNTFIEMEPNSDDAAYHRKGAPTEYYISFDGCIWHPATKIGDEKKAYTVEGQQFIWFEGDWLNAIHEAPFFYSLDELNVRTYYEYVGSEWIIAEPYVRVTTSDPTQTRALLSLNEAVAVANSYKNPTITILRDMKETTTPFSYIASNTTCTLDLNGHKAEIRVVAVGDDKNNIPKMLTLNGANTTFTITDNTAEKKGELRLIASTSTATNTQRWSGIYVQNGSLIMQNGTVHVDHPFTWVSNSNTGLIQGILVASGKSFTMNGGKVYVEADYNPYGICGASGTPTITVNGGTIETVARTKDSPYSIIGYGTINVTGTGEVRAIALKSSSSRGVSVSASSSYQGTLNVTGGTIYSEATSSAQGVNCGGTVVVTGDYNATTPDNTPKSRHYAKANISGGTITAVCSTGATCYGVLSYGTTTISGGTIISTVQKSNQSDARGVCVNGGTTTIQNGANITANAPTKAYGVYCSGANGDSNRGWPHVGVVNITGGTITANTTNTTIAYGLLVTGATWTIAKTNSYSVFNGDYAAAGTAVVTGGNFYANAKTTIARGIAVAATLTKNAASATPKCTINGGYYKMTGTGDVLGCNASALPANFQINGGYYSHNGNLATYAVSPKQVVTLLQTDPNRPDYEYKVAEAYTVTFKNGDTQLQSGYQEVGKAPVYEGDAPTKASTTTASYVFDGWSTTDGGALVSPLPALTSAGATYYAHFAETTLKYMATFDAKTNGGNEDAQVIYVEPAAGVGTLPTATKEGYTFNGWYTAASGGTKITASTVPAGDVTYYAQFTVNSYNLTWVLGDGGKVATAGKYGSTSWPAKNSTETPTTKAVPYGSALTAPVVSRTGYTFVNWGGAVAATMPAEALTYTAVWRAKTNTKYTVNHYQQNMDCSSYPTEPSETEALTGTTATTVTPAVKSYDGFNSPSAQTVTIAGDGSTEVNYYYPRLVYTFTLDAYTNGGTSEVPSIEVIHGATIGAVPPDAQKGCNDFTGWYTKPVGGVKITPEFVIEYDMKTLYAQFSDDVRTYLITYNAGENGTGTVDAGTKTCDVNTTLSNSTFTRDGYTQTGWSLTDGGAKEYELGAAYTDNDALTLYPVWTLVGYQINFVDEDGTTTLGDYPKTLNPGAAVTAPAEPTKDADATNVYTFAGWSDGTNTYASADIPVATAAVTYTATYSSVPSVASVTVGGETTYYATLQAAFDYAANKTTPTIVVLKDIKLTAKVTYTNTSQTTVTFDLNGHTVSGGASQLFSLTSAANTGGLFIIKSSVEGGQIYNKLSSTSARYCVYQSKGKLRIESGTIYNENTNTGASYAVYANRTFTMTGGKLEAKGKTSVYGLYSFSTSSISGGEIVVNETTSGTSAGVCVMNGKTTISGDADIQVNGTASAFGARVGYKPNSSSGAAYNGTLEITGGKFTVEASGASAIGVYSYAGTRAIASKGNFVSAGTAIVSGGEFDVTASTKAYGVSVTGAVSIATAQDAEGNSFPAASATSTATITGGKFNIESESDDNATAYAMNNSATADNLIVQGGIYSSNKISATATIDSKYTAPTKDCNYHVLPLTGEDPYKFEVAEAYSVTFNNYNGTSLQTGYVKKGVTPTYDGETPTKDADATNVYTHSGWTPALSAVTGEKTYTATYSTTPTVASVTAGSTTKYFETIDKAFSVANTSTTYEPTITLLRDATTTTTSYISYAGAKNCTFDLNGHTLSSTTAQALLFINKEGITFTITDLTESKSGTLHLQQSTGTDNRWCVYVLNGNLQMDAGTVFLQSKATQFNEGIRIDPNASTFTMNGGKVHVVTSDGKPACGIVSRGVAVINGGEIQVEASGAGYGIEARVKGTDIGNVTVNGGKFLVTGATAACAYKSAANATLKLQGGYYNSNTDLEANCAANYHVLPLTGEDPYNYEVAEAYSVTFNNYNGTSLQTGYVKKGATPTYNGATPTKAADAQYTYTFTGWAPAITAVTADATYTAQYSSTPKQFGDWLDIVDWTTNAIVINTNGYTSSLKSNLSGWQIKYGDETYNKSKRASDRTLSIPVSGLTPDATIVLKGVDANGAVESYHTYTVPHIYNSSATLSGTTANSVLFVRGGTLTVGSSTTVKAIYVAPGAELKINSGATLTVDKLVLRTRAFQSAVLTDNGTLNATNLYYSRIVADNSTAYPIAFPFNITIANTIFSNGKPAVHGSHYALLEYDAESRAENGMIGNWRRTTGATMLKNHGYDLLSTSKYYYEILFPVSMSDYASRAKDNAEVAVSNPSGSATIYDQGWNFLCSPYTTIFNTGLSEGVDPSEALKITKIFSDNKTYKQLVLDQIEPATAFYYQATGSESYLTFTNGKLSLRSPRRSQNGVSSVQTQWLRLRYSGLYVDPSDESLSDETSIYLHPTKFTPDYERGYDLVKMSKTAPMPVIYSSVSCGDLAFAALPDDAAHQPIPLTVYNPAQGDMVFTLDSNRYLTRLEHVYLIDAFSGEQVDLLHDSYAYFAGTAGTISGRFFLQAVLRSTQHGGTTTDLTPGASRLWTAQGAVKNITVNGVLHGDTLRCYDAAGRLISQTRGSEAQQGTLNITVPAAGLYIIRLNNQTQKVIVK